MYLDGDPGVSYDKTVVGSVTVRPDVYVDVYKVISSLLFYYSNHTQYNIVIFNKILVYIAFSLNLDSQLIISSKIL